MKFRAFRLVGMSIAMSISCAAAAYAEENYFVGDGDFADFSLEVKDGKEAFLYLTKKPVNEPLDGATVSLQPGSGGGGDIQFEAVKGTHGTYHATLAASAVLPGQILIQTESDSDAIGTVVPKYKVVAPMPTVEAQVHSGNSSFASKEAAIAFAAGVTLAILGVVLLMQFRRRRGIAALFVFSTLPFVWNAKQALAHGGHDHSGPSMEGGADAGSDVVMPKKSQILIDLRTIPAKKEAVPGVIKTYGHILPKPQLDATITAPQAGFLHGTQGLSLGTKVHRGQLLGTLQAVGPIRIESPIDGEISEVDAVDGARIDAGGKLLRVTNLSVIWVDAEMFANQLIELGRVTDVTVAVEGVSLPVKAKLLNAVSPVSEETRTAKVYLELISPPPAMRMGMLATVSFALERKTEAILLPASSVLNKAGDRIIFVQTGPETFGARQVVTEDGPTAGTVLVTQGINDGDRVVVSGNYQLLMKAK